MAVRRLLVVALVAGTCVAVDAGPAAAHLCARPAEIPVGTADTVEVAVTVEGNPVPDVEITIPSPLRLERADPVEGWKITRSGSTLRYRGGPIAPYSCQYFSTLITAPVKGHWAIAVIQRTAAGTIVARSGTETDPTQRLNPLLEQTVYAGEKPPSTSPGTSISFVVLAGVGFLVVALGLIGFFGWRAWRARHDEYADLDDEQFEAAMRDLEIQERLAEFKKRTRRRPARR